MALTITSPASSTGYLPVMSDNNIYTFVSDKASNYQLYPEFFYKVDIYVNTDNVTNRLAESLTFLSLGSEPIKLNINRTIARYIEPVFENNMSGLFSCYDTDSKPRIAKVYITVTEKWRDDNNAGASSSSQTRYYWNSTMDWWSSLDAWNAMAGYQYDGTSSRLSGRPNILGAKKPAANADNHPYEIITQAALNECYRIGINHPQTFTACIMNDSLNSPTYGKIYDHILYIAVYDKTGTSVKYYHSDSSTTSAICRITQNFTNHLITFPCGACQINKLIDDNLLTMVSQNPNACRHIDLSEDRYYQVMLLGLGYGLNIFYSATVPLTFELMPYNEGTYAHHFNHPHMNILYWSSDGAWWYIPCYRHNTKTITVKNDIITRPNTIQRNYTNLGVRGKDVVNVDVDMKWNVETELIIDENEIAEVEDMLKSPYIYLVDDCKGITETNDAIYYPVYVDNYEANIDTDKGVSQYIINFNAAYNINTLR